MTTRKIPTSGGPVLTIQPAPSVTDGSGAAWCGNCGMDAPDHYEDCEERTLPPASESPTERARKR